MSPPDGAGRDHLDDAAPGRGIVLADAAEADEHVAVGLLVGVAQEVGVEGTTVAVEVLGAELPGLAGGPVGRVR